jgi:uncharacterized protein (DUF885 family)
MTAGVIVFALEILARAWGQDAGGLPAASSLGVGFSPPGALSLDASSEPMRAAIERYSADRRSLERFYTVRFSPHRRERLLRFDAEWREALEGLDFGALERDGQVDAVLLRNALEREQRALAREAARVDDMKRLVPFGEELSKILDARQRLDPIEPPAIAERLVQLTKQVSVVQAEIEKDQEGGKKRDSESERAEKPTRIEEVDETRIKRAVANRAAAAVGDLRRALAAWNQFYQGYDPIFTWWVAQPYKALDQALEHYGSFLRERVVGVGEGDRTSIVGDPVGRQELLDELEFEMIPYSPEELIAIGERELAWCEAELKKAARDMGHGDDWKAALEEVKRNHLEPGEQPRFVKQLANEAIEFLENRDLITVPELAREVWRLEMMSPQAQLQNPFFLGGESIIVAFPTDAMEHEAKMMSLRGNNVHFARATVFHELIPGHNLQAFMTARYRPYRRVFGTPFWTEGWALYWEIRLWELDFPRSPQDRIGMLFWRAHRGARILFSLKFHTEEMTAQECVDFLVDRVGHEQANAEAEVRRSFQGDYEPLYQCAYLIGGLQFRALHRELVESGKMSERHFHDSVLKLGTMPVAMVRASLIDDELSPSGPAPWRFVDGPRVSGAKDR